MDPHYVKAYHRRGSAYLALRKYELAIKDFQYILEKNPDDKSVNSLLRDAREGLFDQQEGNSSKSSTTTKKTEQPAAKKGFKKVAIVEESESDEDQEDKENESR